MTALLKLFPLESIIAWLLRTLRGITAEQWKFALLTVGNLVDQNLAGKEKYDVAKKKLRDLGLSSESCNWLIETALSYLLKR